MSYSIPDVISAAVTLFLITDPFGNMPIFHTILKDFNPKRRQRIIVRELIFALIILFAFLFAGTSILKFFGVEQPVLNIAGGIILFLIALRMVFPATQLREEEDVTDPFIVPLAMPLIAGPSAMAVLIVHASSAPDKMLEWSSALLIAWGLGAIILFFSPTLMNFLGKRGTKALERLMGLLLILISIQMFLDGVAEYIQSFLA